MKTTQTVLALTLALVSGMIATALLSGCQKPSTPRTSGSTGSNTTAVDDVTISIPEVAVGESIAPEPAGEVAEKPAAGPVDKNANAPVKPGDWPQWAGTSYRNNTPIGKDIPIEWNVGGFDLKTGDWISDDAKNIKWVAAVGSQTYGNPVVAGGRVYVGTNNGKGWLKRYPSRVDLGCLLAFSDADGSFLWQDSSEKLPTGFVHDWPLQGICCAPLVEGDRLWYVTSRGEVKCLDTEGYHDGEDDGPVQNQLAAIFDILRNEDAEQDQVGPAAKELDEGKLPALLREQFKERGVELPEEVAVTADAPGKKWTLTAKLGDADRTFNLVIAGPRLKALKVVTPDDKEEADVVWSFDMMKPPEGSPVLGISQHNMCSCSVTALGDILFVNTSNGVDESHLSIPAPDAPSFMAMDKTTGEIYWSDKSPGLNILHGQWSSPTVAHLGGVDQVIFAAGDGWAYSFKADKGQDGKPELLWKFDANPKTSKWIIGGRGTRNNIIATPVVYDGLVYVAVGQDPEHGEGEGHVWCIDPTKRGDVSPQLAMKVEGDTRVPIPHRRIQAVIEEEGEIAVDNDNSAAIWHYSQYDQNGDGAFDFEEEMHRSCGTVAIQDDLLYIADFSGLFHCLDAKSGKVHWTYDMLASAWGSPMIVEGHVYIGDEDGDVSIFNLSGDPEKAMKRVVVDVDEDGKEETELVPINATKDEDDKWPVTNMLNSVYSTPVVANDVLYISNKTHIFAIQAPPAAE
ncbi:MAG: PQQ-binding-like beta-propeller repeat protein [Planctomycetota bacterium]|nr:PQQ-binding-like beta-propeller repeat protein [Planctomycetota bacterium]